jgi:hypothetical protein
MIDYVFAFGAVSISCVLVIYYDIITVALANAAQPQMQRECTFCLFSHLPHHAISRGSMCMTAANDNNDPLNPPTTPSIHPRHYSMGGADAIRGPLGKY